MVKIDRPIVGQIIQDLQKKMVFLVGPRQVGKTWLSKEVAKHYARPQYINYDDVDSRAMLREKSWPRGTDLLILDEIHKMRGWKNFVKGLYDTKPEGLHMLITGSAKLNAHRHAGDSMAGRYFVHRIFPFTHAEIMPTAQPLERLFERSGFPDPYRADDARGASRWHATYTDSLLQADAVDLVGVDNLYAFRSVFELLKSRVGSPISYANIALDVGVSPGTVKRYIQALEALYAVFIVRPYSHKIARAIRKEPKVYLFDYALVHDEGARYENMLALELLAHTTNKKDREGADYTLAFVKNKQGNEVDFVLVNDRNELERLVEAKISDIDTHPGLTYFSEKYDLPGSQVVLHPRHERQGGAKIDVVSFDTFVRDTLT